MTDRLASLALLRLVRQDDRILARIAQLEAMTDAEYDVLVRAEEARYDHIERLCGGRGR